MKKSPLISIGIRNGTIAGVLAIVLLIAMYYIGRHPLMISPFFDFRVLLLGVFIFFTLKEYRDYHQDGALLFSQGIIGSFVMVLIAAILASILLLVFCEVEPAFLRSYIKARIEYLKSFPEEEIKLIGKEIFERNLADLPATNSKQIVSTYFFQSMVIGFFVSIILSVILRKEPKPL